MSRKVVAKIKTCSCGCGPDKCPPANKGDELDDRSCGKDWNWCGDACNSCGHETCFLTDETKKSAMENYQWTEVQYQQALKTGRMPEEN